MRHARQVACNEKIQNAYKTLINLDVKGRLGSLEEEIIQNWASEKQDMRGDHFTWRTVANMLEYFRIK